MRDFEYGDDLAALGDAHTPTEAELDRLSGRVLAAAGQEAPRPGSALRWAAVAIVLLAAGLGWWAARMAAPDAARSLPTGDVAVAPGVEADVAGRGTARTQGGHTELAWEEGTVTLDVTPAAGRRVSIETQEAVVRVVGTQLTVARGPFGTSVAVDHGVVEVVCRALGAPIRLEGGEETLCLRDAAAGLGRTLLLERQGAPVEARLAVIERALAYPSELDTTRTLLVERQIGALAELGRQAEAAAATHALPEAERRTRLAAGATDAMLASGCEAAEPWLIALVELGDAAGTLLQIQCTAESEPAAARRLLEGLDPEQLTPPQRATWDRWRQVWPR